MTHRHKAIPEKQTTRCWMYCVDPHKCPSERTHGNVTFTDHCSCGATRQTESNGGKTVSSDWEKP